jgi:hypothetical protein
MKELKYVKLFENFESRKMTNDEIGSICKQYRITDYAIKDTKTDHTLSDVDDGSIDVDGDVYLAYKKLTKLPLKFNMVSGDFDCSNNTLTSLSGFPNYVGGYFKCDGNQLIKSEHRLGYIKMGKDEIGSICKQYRITDYTVNPDGSIDVKGDVDISSFGLKKLPLIFNRVGGYFNCSDNQLTSFIGFPNYIGRGYDCRGNK